MTWDELRGLADRDVHVVGLASTESAAVVRFLWAEGVRRLTVHDFQPADQVKAAFMRFHVGMPRAQREAIWAELADLPFERRLGPDYLRGIEAADAVFVAQAWYLYGPNLAKLPDLRRAGVPFHQLAELYFGLSPAPILAVTGSNGKSTTSRLVEHFLRQTGRTTYYAGNERRSVQVLDKLRAMTTEDWLVLEISNRQLMDLTPRPKIGVVTNVLPNHLDEHSGSMAAYTAVKRKLVQFQTPDDLAVLNADNDATRAMAEGLRGQIFWFSRDSAMSRDAAFRGAWLDAGRIQVRLEAGGEVDDLGPIDASPLVGEHNHENVLAAILAARLAGVPPEVIQRSLGTFRPLRHRIQFVWGADGVAYYDDLNSTTPQATVAALKALPAPITLIVGGDDKGLDNTELAALVARKVRRLVILPGSGADRIEAAVRSVLALDGTPDARTVAPAPEIAPTAPISIEHYADLPAAIRAVVRGTRAGDQVLLSPACPNFFRHFYLEAGEEQGFRALLRDYAGQTDPEPDSIPSMEAAR